MSKKKGWTERKTENTKNTPRITKANKHIKTMFHLCGKQGNGNWKNEESNFYIKVENLFLMLHSRFTKVQRKSFSHTSANVSWYHLSGANLAIYIRCESCSLVILRMLWSTFCGYRNSEQNAHFVYTPSVVYLRVISMP